MSGFGGAPVLTNGFPGAFKEVMNLLHIRFMSAKARLFPAPNNLVVTDREVPNILQSHKWILYNETDVTNIPDFISPLHPLF